MKIISNKLLSYEEEVVEYDNTDSYLADVEVRKSQGWVRDKKPNWYEERMVVVTKYNNGKVV